MRLLPFLVLLIPLAACDKPTEADCKKAAANMQKVEGLEQSGELLETNRFVRQCRAQFSKKAVKCVIAAKTSEDLDKCLPASHTPKTPPAKPTPAPQPTPTAPAPQPTPTAPAPTAPAPQPTAPAPTTPTAPAPTAPTTPAPTTPAPQPTPTAPAPTTK